MEIQEESTHTYLSPQSNQHIQCSQCGAMHRGCMTTPIFEFHLLTFKLQ